MAIDYIKMLTDEESVFSGLFARMDKDADQLNQKAFTLFDKDDREAPDVENLTLPDAAIFTARVESMLNRASQQIEVTGEELKQEECSFYEDFFSDYLSGVDEELQRRTIPDLRAWNTQQLCGRGRIITRVLPQMVEDNFEYGILPLDARYVIYSIGARGLKWVAPKHYRSRQQIVDEYGDEIGARLNGTHATVTDLWIEDRELTFIEKVLAREVRHKGYDELPFVIQLNPLGLMFQDGDQMTNAGESVLYLARQLFEPKNKFASILDTLNMGSIFGGLQLEFENLSGLVKPKVPPYGKRFVVPVQKGTKGFFPMPIADIKMATRLLYSIVDSEIQDATLPRVSYGTLQSPTSGIGIAYLKTAEDPVYYPRLQALSRYYQQLLNMVKKQFVSKRIRTRMGLPGFMKDYSYQNLKKDIRLKVEFTIINPMHDMANLSMAAAAGNLLSIETKMEKYLQVEKPEKETQRKLIERAPLISAIIAKYEIAKALADAGEEVKARIIAEELGITLDQLLGGQPEKTEPLKEKEPKQVLPLFGGGQAAATISEEERALIEEREAD